MLPAGILGDRYGARRVMVPGWFLGTIGTILIAASPNFSILGLGFFFYGLSASALPMISLYVVQSLQLDPTAKGNHSPQRILTFIYALYWISMIVSPAIGGFLADLFSLRLVFWLSVFWFVLSTYTIFLTQPYPVTPKPNLNARELFKQYNQLMRHWRFFVPYTIFLLGFVATALGYTFMPKFLGDVRDQSTSTIGMLSSILALGGFLWNIFLGRGYVWSGFLAAVFLPMIGFALLILSGHWLLLIAAYFCISAFETLRPMCTSIIANRIADEQRGVAFSMVDTLHGIGTFAAPAMAGFFYAQNQILPFMVAMAITPLVLLGVMGLLYAENYQGQPTPITSSPSLSGDHVGG
jgi:predicted MFS family arabinose efflux permease